MGYERGNQVHERRRCTTGPRREAQEKGKIGRHTVRQGIEDG